MTTGKLCCGSAQPGTPCSRPEAAGWDAGCRQCAEGQQRQRHQEPALGARGVLPRLLQQMLCEGRERNWYHDPWEREEQRWAIAELCGEMQVEPEPSAAAESAGIWENMFFPITSYSAVAGGG